MIKFENEARHEGGNEGIDCAAREGEEEGGGEEGEEDEVFAPDSGRFLNAAGGKIEVEGVEGWGEEKIAHELRFESEAVGMRKTKGGGSATETEERSFARGAEKVEKTLKPTSAGEDNRGGEKDGSKLRAVDFRGGF